MRTLSFRRSLIVRASYLIRRDSSSVVRYSEDTWVHFLWWTRTRRARCTVENEVFDSTPCVEVRRAMRFRFATTATHTSVNPGESPLFWHCVGARTALRPRAEMKSSAETGIHRAAGARLTAGSVCEVRFGGTRGLNVNRLICVRWLNERGPHLGHGLGHKKKRAASKGGPTSVKYLN